MKKLNILLAIPLTILFVAVFAVSVQAQEVDCPAGYMCTPLTHVSNCYVFNNYLTLGNTGEDVVAAQNFLISSGYHIPAIENGDGLKGLFGPQTLLAIRKFQSDEGIEEKDFGTTTRIRMFETCASKTVTGVQTLTPTSQVQDPDQGVFLNMTFPSNTIKSRVYLSCPEGITVKSTKSASGLKCATLLDVTNDETIKFTLKNSTSNSLSAVLNYYVYTSDSPEYSKGVWASITVPPVIATTTPSYNASIWDAVVEFFGL